MPKNPQIERLSPTSVVWLNWIFRPGVLVSLSLSLAAVSFWAGKHYNEHNSSHGVESSVRAIEGILKSFQLTEKLKTNLIRVPLTEDGQMELPLWAMDVPVRFISVDKAIKLPVLTPATIADITNGITDGINHAIVEAKYFDIESGGFAANNVQPGSGVNWPKTIPLISLDEAQLKFLGSKSTVELSAYRVIGPEHWEPFKLPEMGEDLGAFSKLKMETLRGWVTADQHFLNKGMRITPVSPYQKD